MEADIARLIIAQVPNFIGFVVAVFMLYRIITKNQADIQDELEELKHEVNAVNVQLATLAERLNSNEAE